MKIPSYACKADVVSAMHEWVMGLHAERNKAIFSRKMIDGITYERIAEEFDLSDRQVKNIVYKVADIVYAHIPV